jgi:hypothetical protein
VRAIGKLTTWVVLALAAVAVVVVIKSIPDLKRYREIREM